MISGYTTQTEAIMALLSLSKDSAHHSDMYTVSPSHITTILYTLPSTIPPFYHSTRPLSIFSILLSLSPTYIPSSLPYCPPSLYILPPAPLSLTFYTLPPALPLTHFLHPPSCSPSLLCLHFCTLPYSIINLGADSDYTMFLQFQGISCTSYAFVSGIV